jgi:hypothetical protein
MPQREFDITIAADGRVELQIHGYKGKGCLDMMKVFQEIVGELESQSLTQDYYAPDEDVRRNVERQH